MGDVKKWTVMYTKHVKQKRKVYQDGFLHLLNNKVNLYDEWEQLLGSKFLSKDEAVKSGESLTFASFLVDIGDPDHTCNSSSNTIPISEHESKPKEKIQMQQGEKLRNTFTYRKPNTAGRKSSSICLSPSQKIIKEFKRNEVLKYGAHQSLKSPATSSSKDNSVSHDAKRGKEFAQRDDLASKNAVLIGQPRGEACSSKHINPSTGSSGLDKIKQEQNLASGRSLRDANQILSIIRKPPSRDTMMIAEDAHVEQCLSVSSGLVHLDDDNQPFDGAFQVNQRQLPSAEKTNNNKAASSGDTGKCSKANGPRSGSTEIDLAAPIVNADCSSNNVEKPLSMQGVEILRTSAFECTSKSQSTVGSSVSRGRSVVLDSSKGADFKENRISVSSEATSHNLPSPILQEINPENEGKTSSDSDMSKPKLTQELREWFGDDVGVKKTMNFLKTQKSNIISDCPSFDLGI